MTIFPRFALISCVFLNLGLVDAQAETLVIVRKPMSTDASSKRYNENDPVISLKPGEVAAVTYADRSSDEIAGPFEGRLSQVSKTRRDRDSMFARTAYAYRGGRDRQDGVGSSRAGEKAATTPEGVTFLDISIDTDQVQCFYSPPLRLWRNDSTVSERVVVSKMGGGAALVEFPLGVSVVPWPTGVGIGGDSSYVLSRLDNAKATQTFTLHTLSSVDSRDEITMATLLDEGCLQQAGVMADLAARR